MWQHTGTSFTQAGPRKRVRLITNNIGTEFQGRSPIGRRQSWAFWFSAILGLTPPSQAMGLVLIDSTPPARPMS